MADRARERSTRFAKPWCDSGFKRTFIEHCRNHHIGVEVVTRIHPLALREVDPAQLPVCILPSAVRLAPATVDDDVAAGLGMVSAPMLSEYDLAIVGAGPAGLGASVFPQRACEPSPSNLAADSVIPCKFNRWTM